MATSPTLQYSFEGAIATLVNQSTLNEKRKEELKNRWEKKSEGKKDTSLSYAEAYQVFFFFPDQTGIFYFSDAFKYLLGTYSLGPSAMSHLRGKWHQEVEKENIYPMMLSMRAAF